VREDHPLGRLQGERHQPVDQLPVITPIKLPQLEPVEQLLEVLASSLIALCVLRPGGRCHLQLRGDDPEQRGIRRLTLREDPTGMAQVNHLNGQPEPVVIAAVLTNVREIRARQRCEPNQLALILREGEQLHSFSRRQQFASRHRVPPEWLGCPN